MESVYLADSRFGHSGVRDRRSFWWSVRSGQFDDLEGPGFRILMDDDKPKPPAVPDEANKSEKV
jgi:nitrogen fixation-related uncharacterized protein